MIPSFPRQVASVVLRTAPVFHEPPPADARWDALKAHLRTEAAGWRKESREWKDDSPNQRQFVGMARMAELTVAKMSELEQQR